eukprot:GHVU01008257.1.p1 GENE.GHVU01008257.1~~GHVU01008257.1.p1  ORF type:complete len:326 (-),score=39.24 GHVU01008257.1:1635-2489(-)
MRSPVVGSRGPQLELKHLFLPAGAGSEKLSCPRVRLIGAPMARGQAQPGVETAPKKVREAGLLNALQGLGVSVADHGDVVPNANENDLEDNSENESQDKIERVYTQIGRFNGRLYEAVKAAADAGDFVLTIGGDHGVATGTISGMLAKYPDLAVIWVDAHADCNTPATSPSGNYHGMPVAHLMRWFEPPGFDWRSSEETVPTLTSERIVYIGLRCVDPPEAGLMREHHLACFDFLDVERYGIAEVGECSHLLTPLRLFPLMFPLYAIPSRRNTPNLFPVVSLLP